MGFLMASAMSWCGYVPCIGFQKQKWRWKSLKDLTQPVCNVIRNGEIQEVKSEELVLGDSLW